MSIPTAHLLEVDIEKTLIFQGKTLDIIGRISSSIKTSGGTTDSFLAMPDANTMLVIERKFKSLVLVKMKKGKASLNKRIKCRIYLLSKLSEAYLNGGRNGIKAFLNDRKDNGIAEYYLRRAYVLCFYELFISGKYDSLFLDEGIPYGTKEVLGE